MNEDWLSIIRWLQDLGLVVVRIDRERSEVTVRLPTKRD